MACNKRFTNQVTWSVLEIRSPHIYEKDQALYGPSNPVSKSLILTIY